MIDQNRIAVALIFALLVAGSIYAAACGWRRSSWKRVTAVVDASAFESQWENTLQVVDISWFENDRRHVVRRVEAGSIEHGILSVGDTVIVLVDPHDSTQCAIERSVK